MSNWWEGFDWRFIQTNLREIDMKDINAKQYVTDMKSFHANIAMINAAGIIASYPTKLQYHYQSPYLTGDSLETIISECHNADIKVIARTDFSKIRRPVFEARPEWAYRTVSGDIVDYQGDVHACLNGGYQKEYALEIIRECITLLDFDGIFFNMAGYQVKDYSNHYYGICHCESCKKLFYDKHHLVLPKKEDITDPVFRTYRIFKQETAAAHNERICRFIRELRPDILINRDYYTCRSGMIRQESNTALDRPLPHWQYSGSENTKWVRASFKHFISSNTSVDFWDFPIRHTAVSPTQQETRLWQNLANGGHLDYYLIGRLDNHDDTSGYEAVKRVFAYHEQHQELYRDNESVADIALITPDHWGGFGENREAAGLYRILTEGHYFFDVLFLSRLSLTDVDKYALLILADLTDIGDKDAEILDAFVYSGGKILCTGCTGKNNENAESRVIPALSSMGLEHVGIVQDARGAYFELSQADHDLFRRFEGVNLVAIDGDYVYAPAAADTKSLLRMLPPQPYGPPERCYSHLPATMRAAALIKKSGQGCCVTIPWYPGRIFYRQGYPNTMNFVLDILEGCLNMRPVETDLPPMVEITLSKTMQEGSWLLHLVNQTGHFGNSFYPPVSIGASEFTFDFPQSPFSVESLTGNGALSFNWERGRLKICLEKLGIFEAIHIKA